MEEGSESIEQEAVVALKDDGSASSDDTKDEDNVISASVVGLAEGEGDTVVLGAEETNQGAENEGEVTTESETTTAATTSLAEIEKKSTNDGAQGADGNGQDVHETKGTESKTTSTTTNLKETQETLPKDITSLSPQDIASSTVNTVVDKTADTAASVKPESSSSGKSCVDDTNRTYYVKWIIWKGVRTPIVTQNDNGPCPLLAIINILLLRRAIEFPTMQEMVTTSQLMEYLGDHVLKEVPENMGEGDQRNFEQNMQDAFSILPKLKTGLDVNVKFTGVADFEFTPECVIFDLLNIHLYHGWLVDPQNIEYKDAIGGLSYNQLVEKIIANNEKNKDGGELSADGVLAEAFLNETANQLTYHGLCELNAKVKQDELCVFFRNNHFSTLYKHQKELFVLLTDQGFLTEDQIVWQTLPTVDGDGVFVNGSFKTLPMKGQPVSGVATSKALSQEDQDYMLALSIQNEQQEEARSPSTQQQQQQQQQQQDTPQPTPSVPSDNAQQPSPEKPSVQAQAPQGKYDPAEQELLDLQYAIRLQEEENQHTQPISQQQGAAAAGAAAGQQQPQQRRTNRRQTPPPPQQPSHNQPARDGQGKSCTIL